MAWREAELDAGPGGVRTAERSRFVQSPFTVAFQPEPNPIEALSSIRAEIGQQRIAIYEMSHAHAAQFEHVLSPDERTKVAEMTAERARRRLRTGRVLLRNALSSFVNHIMKPTDWRFARLSSGRLVVVNPGLIVNFSLSHTESGAAVAISELPVGFDATEIDQPLACEDAACFLTPSERRRADRQSQQQRSAYLLALWALKESHLKLRGTGLAIDPTTVEFELEAAPRTDHALCLQDTRGARSVVYMGRVGGREVITSLAV